jgi:hydrogenase expression/formation protein HypD
MIPSFSGTLFEQFKDRDRVLRVAEQLHKEVNGKLVKDGVGRSYSLMEFCGGHTHAVFRYGLNSLLPAGVKMVHGPGCPVCVLPQGKIDAIIKVAERESDLIICTYADLLRIPAAGGKSLLKQKAAGADIRMVYSPLDAVKVAANAPDRPVMFVAIGFETTAPATAVAISEASRLGLKNFFVYCLHLLTPPAVQKVLQAPAETVAVDGWIGPGHVCSVIGVAPLRIFAETHGRPVVISGFAPLDLMQSILMLVQMINRGRLKEISNQYSRAVLENGNQVALAAMSRVFQTRPFFEWRGFGLIANSGLRIRDEFSAYDAETCLAIEDVSVGDHPACQCAAIIRGQRKPDDCKLFRRACRPEHPVGPCMVSSEGACAAYFQFINAERFARGFAADEVKA